MSKYEIELVEETRQKLYDIFADGCGCECCKLIEKEMAPIIKKLYKFRVPKKSKADKVMRAWANPKGLRDFIIPENNMGITFSNWLNTSHEPNNIEVEIKIKAKDWEKIK